MRKIIRLQKKCGVMVLLKLQISAMHQQYKEYIYNYGTFRKTAATSRSTFQDKLIEELSLAGNIEASSIRLKIKHVEASYAQNRRIKYALRKNIFTVVKQVDMIHPLTTEAIHLRDKEDIEAANIEYLPVLIFMCR